MNKTVTPVSSNQQIDVLAALAKDIWNQHFPSIIGQEQVDYMLAKFQSREAIQSQIACGYEYYLAMTDDSPAGYMCLVPNEPPGKMMLSKIYVKDSSRDAGLGTSLLEYATKHALETKAESLWLTVNRDNSRTIEWYKKRGFTVIDEVKKDIGGGFYMDDYIMEYKLVE